MADKNELTFKDESEMLAHPSVVKAIDEATSTAEQDSYDKNEKLKDMVIKQAVAIGLETDSFITSSLKDAIGTGDEEKISESYESIQKKLADRSIDSLCDTLSDINEVYMMKIKGSDTIQKKVQDAINREPGDGNDSEGDKKTDKNKDKKNDKPTGTDKDKKNDKPTGTDKDKKNDKPTEEPKEDVNNPDGGDSTQAGDKPDDKDDVDDAFGRVVK